MSGAHRRGPLLEVDEARRRLAEAVQVLGTEPVPLERAHGRVLGERVVADRDAPPTDRSAMDGFAVDSADVSGTPCTLEVAGEVRAGAPAGRVSAGSGRAVRIFTGAVIPPGADAVVMVERTHEERAAGRVRIDEAPRPGQHIRRRGQDRRAGETVLEPGVPLRAPEIAALATVGHTRIEVHRTPRVAVLATGDEIVEARRAPLQHQVRDSNAHGLLAQLRELGIVGCSLGIARDRGAELGEALERGLAGDLLLVTGGVSVGEYDLVRAGLERAGVEVLFHGVAVKPGKPILAGRRGPSVVVGLPGNPVSAYAGFAVFVAPALRRMMGLAAWRSRPVPVTLAGRLRQRPGRTTFHLARVEPGEHGLVAHPVPTSGSGDVLSLVRANAFVVVPADAEEVAAGTSLEALPWEGFADPG